MNALDFIKRVRFDFNDLDKDRVDDAIILDYLNEGLRELFKLNPKLFLKTVVAKLVDGDLQTPCCCDLLHSIEAITDENGNFISDIKHIDNRASVAFNKKQCESKERRSYQRVKGTDNQFVVKPPISPNENVSVRLLCSIKPKKIDIHSNFSDEILEHYGLLVDYVLYRLYGAETESVSSQNKSAMHYKQFTEVMLATEKVRSSFVSEGE